MRIKLLKQQKKNDVPLYKDNKLANTLSKLEIGDVIPPELYEVVAEILVFVDDMDKLKAKIG
nr:EscU/YscU/HrcU family type III secretion system export apparatus switch protein [Lachnobacterium bovis]